MDDKMEANAGALLLRFQYLLSKPISDEVRELVAFQLRIIIDQDVEITALKRRMEVLRNQAPTTGKET